MQSAPHRGTVYGTSLNHHDALAAMGGAVHNPRSKAPRQAPTLHIKPRNTWLAAGEAIVVPHGVEAVGVGATLGLVIGRSACRVSEADAMSFVAGYVIVNDVSVPQLSHYRPSLRSKARDSFCPIGPFVPRHAIGAPDALAISVAIDGRTVHQCSTAGLIRPVARLLAEVSDFMTLAPGDVLTVGVAAGAPRARVGQVVCIVINGLGRLENPLVAEPVLRPGANKSAGGA